MHRPAVTLALAALAACTASDADDAPLPLPERVSAVQAVSLLGDTLRPPVLDSTVRSDREAALTGARAAFVRHPDDPDSIIWFGRRLAYLGDYRSAIDVFSWGIERHPGDPRLYRHRGHRYITVRELDRALADFLRATQLVAAAPDAVEPDGLPNARGVPTSTLKSNIWYHLGLVHYLRGDFRRAASAYRECLRYAASPDMDVAARYWLNTSLRRLGADAEADAVLERVTPDQDIIENHDYHRLLLVYKGLRTPDAVRDTAHAATALSGATLAYGLANWRLTAGDTMAAVALMREIRSGAAWPAFGFIAAEADLARIGSKGGTS